MRPLLLLLLLSLSACRAAPSVDQDIDHPTQVTAAQLTVVPSIPAAYFAAVGSHEGGHALVLGLYGAHDIRVRVLPDTHSLGDTSARLDRPLRPTPGAWVDVAGPGMNMATGILARETLKSGYVPLTLQPAVQWLAVLSKTIFFGECGLGLARSARADLGKQPIWICLTFLSAELIYDLWDLIFCDSVERYFGSLFGLRFYG